MNNRRIVLLDLMQGLAMILVVIGHHLFPFMPEWYRALHYYIYLFHMPFFIFISAFLIRYSYKEIKNTKEYYLYILRKARKFIPPYLVIGVICIILKRPQNITEFCHKTALLIYEPLSSEATFLWYIYLLFIFYLISPIVFFLSTRNKIVLLAICFLISLQLPETNYFCISYFCKLSPFYMAGVLAAERWGAINKFNPMWGIPALLCFCVLSLTHFIIGYNHVLEIAISWIAIPSMTYIAWLLGNIHILRNMLTSISINCFGIYLLHMFFIQGIALLFSYTNVVCTTQVALIYLTISVITSITMAAYSWKGLNRLLKL